MGIDEIMIFSADGSIRANVVPNDGSMYSYELMNHEWVKLKFNLRTPTIFKLGDFIDIPEFGWKRFELTSLTRPTHNDSNGAWQYEIQFDADYWRLKNRILYYDRQSGNECSFSLTTDIESHVSIVLSNIDAIGYMHMGEAITASFDGTVQKGVLKNISYQNISIIDSLNAIAEAFECEWWFENDQINFGKCERGELVDMQEGDEVNEMTANDSAEDYCTRIIAFGSERNLTSKYRQGEEATISHISKRRLMLPEDTPYIDVQSQSSDAEIVEKVYVFDDIYPRRVGTIDSISTKEYSDEDEETGEITTWSAFRFTDRQVNFSNDFLLQGEQHFMCQFQSGNLAGMEFEISFNPDGEREKNDDGSWNTTAQVYEIIRNDEYGINLPSDEFAPKVGDNYVIYNFDATKLEDIKVDVDGEELGLISAAELELKNEALKQAEKLRIDTKSYQCKMNMVRFYGYTTGVDGRLVHNESNEMDFLLGQRVRLLNDAYFANGRESRIRAIEKSLDGRSVTYIIAENASYSRLNALEKSIETTQITGGRTGSYGATGNYLSKDGDKSNGTFELGMVKSPFVVSDNVYNKFYDYGRGYRLFSSADDGSNPFLSVADNDGGTLPFYSKSANEVCDVSSKEVKSFEIVYTDAFVLQNIDKGAFVRFNASYTTSGYKNGFTDVGVRVYVKKVYEIQPGITPRDKASAVEPIEWEEVIDKVGDEYTLYLDSGGLLVRYSLKIVCEYVYNPRLSYTPISGITIHLDGSESDNTTYFSGSKKFVTKVTAKDITIADGSTGIVIDNDGIYRNVNGRKFKTFGGAYVISEMLDFSLGTYDVINGVDAYTIRHIVEELMSANISQVMTEPIEVVIYAYINTDTPDGLVSGCFSVRSTAIYIDTDENKLHIILCVMGKNLHIKSISAVTGAEQTYSFTINEF